MNSSATTCLAVSTKTLIGQYLQQKIEADAWAKGTVVQLAGYIAPQCLAKLH